LVKLALKKQKKVLGGKPQVLKRGGEGTATSKAGDGNPTQDVFPLSVPEKEEGGGATTKRKGDRYRKERPSQFFANCQWKTIEKPGQKVKRNNLLEQDGGASGETNCLCPTSRRMGQNNFLKVFGPHSWGDEGKTGEPEAANHGDHASSVCAGSRETTRPFQKVDEKGIDGVIFKPEKSVWREKEGPSLWVVKQKTWGLLLRRRTV